MSVKRPLSETVPGDTAEYHHSELKRNKMNCFGLGRNGKEGKEEKMNLEPHDASSIETREQLFASLNRTSDDVERVIAFLRITNLEGYKEFDVGDADTDNNGRQFAESVVTFHKEDIDNEDDPNDVRRSLRTVLPALYDKIKKTEEMLYQSQHRL